MKDKKNIIYIILIISIIIISFLLISNISNNNNTLKELSYKEIKEKIKRKESFVLVISRSSCSHCATYKPKLKKIASQYKKDLFYIDYDKETKKTQENLFEDFDLDGSTPVTIFIKKGKTTNLFDRIEGDVSEKQIINKLKKLKYIK